MIIKKKYLISIVGPTSVGKTNLSIYLAKKFNTEIISCDSRQFYKELNIGTSKPSKKILKKIKHHFINNLNIYKNYNIYLFEKEVIKKLNKLFNKYNLIIMVGGSCLYEKTIIKGISILPKINKKKLYNLRKKLNNKNIKKLIKKIKKEDYLFFKKLKNKKDKRKIIRALEIKLITKKKFSYLKKKNKIKKRPFDKYLRIGLILKKKQIYENINYNVNLMIKNGLLNEAKNLFKKKNINLNSLNTIGYKEIFNCFLKKKNFFNAINNIKNNTKKYVKKQLIWYKKMKDIKWFKPNQKNKILNYIKNKIK
ncbi:MAG: tRNA (adenosine(37)-N6)-dimethylallyltransferase MiaA [Candidatus Shikimatogenerans sp. JK-2022]|nr:tRNA (adenosine(37)-N6)-dimethylallyltransferase MiaA [Candidatus Shikimatogenerans bostrichidophilus]